MRLLIGLCVFTLRCYSATSCFRRRCDYLKISSRIYWNWDFWGRHQQIRTFRNLHIIDTTLWNYILEGLLKKICFCGLKILFAWGWKTKTHRKIHVFKNILINVLHPSASFITLSLCLCESRQKLKAFNVLKPPEKNRQPKREPCHILAEPCGKMLNSELLFFFFPWHPLTHPDVWLGRPRCCSPPVTQSDRRTPTHSSLRIPPSPHFSVTCLAGTIWALCKTTFAPLNPHHSISIPPFGLQLCCLSKVSLESQHWFLSPRQRGWKERSGKRSPFHSNSKKTADPQWLCVLLLK